MKTVQMTLDEELVRQVDALAKKLKTSRSAFAREALRAAIRQEKVAELERRHRRGYELHPAGADEFGAWEAEQDWGEP
jgi:metal-responsive CopG/Arc/MetJ family transcriptional regulator